MKLKEFREKQGQSQESFARIMGISLQTQYKVENKIIPASRKYMEKLKKLFPEINIDEIFFSQEQQ